MDNEIKGEGNSVNYKFRMHDPRVGRFFATDPLAHRYPWNSPYAFAENRVVRFIELEGLEIPSPEQMWKRQAGTGERVVIGVVVGTFEAGKGTWEFVSKDIWKETTWQSIWRVYTEFADAASYGTSTRRPPSTPALDAIAEYVNKDLINGDAYTRSQFGTQILIGILADKGISKVAIIGRIRLLNLPQGISKAKFLRASEKLKEVLGISDDIVIQGSRASGKARRGLEKTIHPKGASDIDIAIKVDEAKFDKLIEESFGKPNAGSSNERTMLHAIKTGKITSGRAGLRKLRKELETIFGVKVDLSIIKKKGTFDNGKQLPIKE